MVATDPSEASRESTHRPERWPPAAWLAVGVLIGAATWGGIAATQPAGAELLPTVNRWLVRVSLPFFLVAFAATPIARLRPSALARRAVRERRGLGLAWAAIHLTHAVAILAMFEADAENVPPPTVLIFGGAGFALTLAMALTSNDASQRALGRGWRRLHRTGLWYLVFIYVLTYYGRVTESATPWFVFALSALVGISGLRAFVWWRRRSKPGPTAAAAS